LPADEAESDDEQQRVHWSTEVESVHSIPKDMDATPRASAASARRSGRKATPAPSSFNPRDRPQSLTSSTEEMGEDWDLDDNGFLENATRGLESQATTHMADGPSSWLYNLLSAWPKCEPESEECGNEILVE